jgi:uncharacterized membrane protein YtjA (UPF0391 family)
MVLLKWALVFLLVAVAAAILGFTDVAGAAISIARILFFVFLVIFLALLVAGLVGYNRLR